MKSFGSQAVERLQREINAELARRNERRVERIVMDHGSEVADLRRAAYVRVFLVGRDKPRIFNFLTLSFLNDVLSRDWEDFPRPDAKDLYSCGGPLLIAREISGSAIVRGIQYYLDQEEGRAGM